VFACHFVCVFLLLQISQLGRGIKFCMRGGLLSGQVFSPFGEHWLAVTHRGGGITSSINGSGETTASEHVLLCFVCMIA